jgi:hypothetical protein
MPLISAAPPSIVDVPAPAERSTLGPLDQKRNVVLSDWKSCDVGHHLVLRLRGGAGTSQWGDQVDSLFRDIKTLNKLISGIEKLPLRGARRRTQSFKLFTSKNDKIAKMSALAGLKKARQTEVDGIKMEMAALACNNSHITAFDQASRRDALCEQYAFLGGEFRQRFPTRPTPVVAPRPPSRAVARRVPASATPRTADRNPFRLLQDDGGSSVELGSVSTRTPYAHRSPVGLEAERSVPFAEQVQIHQMVCLPPCPHQHT